jgi:hypothetical protein
VPQFFLFSVFFVLHPAVSVISNAQGLLFRMIFTHQIMISSSATSLRTSWDVGEDMSKVKSHIGVQLQSSSFFDNLKGVQP